ncbi:MAG TPA: hypothetical protein PK926_13355 [Spirochaetota bacterium]|nr:hypothetical protein [Spirochaetota bacterium]HPI90917.1 hypothetical protein [Spirochaetota bacterium]HPR48389.1 hypothetical protein [Spirochaetota bacterium]
MEREGLTKAGLARRMNLSRARITQMMNLLKMPQEKIQELMALGESFERRVVTEKKGGG